MRKFLAIALFLLPIRVYCASQAIGGPWGGLNDGDASILIPDTDAQSLQDVDLTQFASGVKKRSGYTQFRTIGVSTWAVRGGYYFRDVSANDVLINANSLSVYKSVNSGAYSAFITTTTNGAYWDFADSLGYLYGANTSNDQLWRYDGTNLTWFPNSPKGSQVEFSPDRFIVTGATNNPNTVYFSKASDPTTFTIGPNNADPFTEVFGLPGQKITAEKYALGRLIVWTKTSTQFWAGTNQYDGVIQDISTTIGCTQPGTVIYDNGIVYWEAQDKHWYAYDGNQIRRISRKIANSVDGIAGSNSKSWSIDSQSEFAAGTVGTGLTSSASPGDMLFSTGTLIDGFTDGDYTASPVWTAFGVSGATANITSGQLKFTQSAAGSIGTIGLYTPWTFSSAVGVKVSLAQLDEADIAGSQNAVLISFLTSTPTGIRTPLPNGTSAYSLLVERSGSLGTLIELDRSGFQVGSTVVIASSVYDAGGGIPSTIELWRSTAGYMAALFNGNVVLSGTDTTLTSFADISVIGYFNAGIITPSNAIVDDFYVKYASAIYTSPVQNIGSAITGYGPFTVNNVLSNGVIDYALYAHNASNISTSVFTSSQTITSGAIPAFGVQPYALWTAQFSRIVSTQTPTLNDVTVNWYEGTPTTHWGTVDKDHRLIWSVAEGTATVPNVSYVYDPRFDAWLKYSFPMDVPAKVGDTIYFGGVSTGVVYNWPSGNNDNGSAITAFWKSKDFIAPDPFVEKDFLGISLITKTQTGSNLDVTYNSNTSSSTLYNISLTDANGNAFIRNNRNLPRGIVGTFFNLKFGNTTTDSPFEVYAIKYDYSPKAWRILP